MDRVRTSVRQLLSNHTYYSVLNAIREEAKLEQPDEAKALVLALRPALDSAELLDDVMEPEGDDEDAGDDESEPDTE